MNCPIDGTLLVMTERSGVEIDYCPQCRGVWLDRGELDKLVARSDDAADRGDRDRDRDRDRYRDDERDRYRAHDDDRRHGKPYKKKKRESFLSEIFDFG
jgi:Zn-finger nucleic acid-binding protein